MIQQSSNSLLHWPHDEKAMATALALAGLVDRSSFDAAHHHIIASVNYRPPRQLYPDWLPQDRRSPPQHTCPQWYKAYKEVWDMYADVQKSRNELEEVITEAQVIVPRYRGGKLDIYAHKTDRELILSILGRPKLLYDNPIGERRNIFHSKKAEIEVKYHSLQKAISTFNRFFEISEVEYLQILSYLCPRLKIGLSSNAVTNLDVPFRLQLQPCGWIVQEQWKLQDPPSPNLEDSGSKTQFHTNYWGLKTIHLLPSPVYTFIQESETNLFPKRSRNDRVAQWVEGRLRFGEDDESRFGNVFPSTSEVEVRRYERLVAKTAKTAKIKKRFQCPFRWGDLDDEDNNNSDDDDVHLNNHHFSGKMVHGSNGVHRQMCRPNNVNYFNGGNCARLVQRLHCTDRLTPGTVGCSQSQ